MFCPQTTSLTVLAGTPHDIALSADHGSQRSEWTTSARFRPLHRYLIQFSLFLAQAQYIVQCSCRIIFTISRLCLGSQLKATSCARCSSEMPPSKQVNRHSVYRKINNDNIDILCREESSLKTLLMNIHP